MTTPELLQRLTVGPDALVGFCRRWKVAKLWLFGSVLSERFAPESDRR
jgi:predicted nucleotidyltransferase